MFARSYQLVCSSTTVQAVVFSRGWAVYPAKQFAGCAPSIGAWRGAAAVVAGINEKLDERPCTKRVSVLSRSHDTLAN